MAKALRIGEVLVDQGVMTEQQVFEVIQAQKSRGLPFGVLAERMFEVSLDSIEKAWAHQYHAYTGTMDLDTCRFEPKALALLNRRQAWQFQILPVATEDTGELLMAAAGHRLPRAVTFAANRLEQVVYFRIAETDQLRRYLQIHYPMPEVGEQWFQRVRNPNLKATA